MQVIMDIKEYEVLKKQEEELKRIRSCFFRGYADMLKNIKSDSVTIKARELILLAHAINEKEAEYVPQEIEIKIQK